MSKVRVSNFSISLDGYGAGPDQSLDEPLGIGGESLHEWMLATRTGRRDVLGMDGGETGVDDDFVARGHDGIGATIMGRNMFGGGPGPWGEDPWNGWWGSDPPFHTPVFVLTHHEREPLEMEGGTTFHFVTDGIEPALARAVEAADGKDVRLGGGAAVAQQYLAAGLVDELQLNIAPILLGGGERLFEGVGADLALEQVKVVHTPEVTHVRYRAGR
jgi:dihydrofolate reductase